MAVVRLQDVSKRFGHRWALAHVSLEVPQGATVLLTGENGAGKTTLLRVLATAVQPTLGRVDLFGLSVREHLSSIRACIGLITHQSHLYEAFTATENLALVQRVLRGAVPSAFDKTLNTGRNSGDVIPANAGIQKAQNAQGLDSRVRGNDAGIEDDANTILLDPRVRGNDVLGDGCIPVGVAAAQPTIGDVLQRVGLAAHAHRPVAGFSAGMRRRLCIARLLLRRPSLVLLDEPFGQLDPAGVELMEGIIGELRQQGVTQIISTHDIDRGLALCDHHLMMAGGRQQGPLREIALRGIVQA